jgi:hypothetical protein
MPLLSLDMSSASPKRKRGHTLPLDTKALPPRLLGDSDLEDHVESPKTKIARQFDDLEIHGHLDKPGNDSIHEPMQAAEAMAQAQPQAPVHVDGSASPQRKRLPQSSTKGMSATVLDSATLPETLPRSKSPPLEGELSEEFWHDSEITGHMYDPENPDDDGYGINGIGFKPTATIAWSRSQQRKQQLDEYKNREAREARQQRSERRKRLFDDRTEAPSTESSPRKAVRVHFEDG